MKEIQLNIDYPLLASDEWKSFSYKEKMNLVSQDVEELLKHVNIAKGYGFKDTGEGTYNMVHHPDASVFLIFGFDVFNEPHVYVVVGNGLRSVTRASQYNSKDFSI